jgi:hypothetical protein
MAPNPFVELGTSGHYSKYVDGNVYASALRELNGKDGRQRLNEMRDTDPVAGAVVTAIELLCRGVKWNVEPADESASAQEEAEFVEGVFLKDMSHSFDDMITDAMSMVVFGWSFIETVYKRRVGPDQADPAMRSDFDDGRIGIRKMVGRSQLTLKRWDLDETGGVQAFVQEVEGKPDGVRIPIERGLLFRTAREMGSPEGRSALRAAYLAFRARRHVEHIELVGIERELTGLPRVKVPSVVLTADSDPVKEAARQAAYAKYEAIARDLKLNEQGGLIYPSDPWFDNEGKPTGIPQYEVDLITSGGTRSIDTNGTIQRLAYDVFRNAMADMMMLGATSAGSFALSKDKSSFFTACITWYVDVIQDTINRHQIARLWDLNGLDHRLKPKFVHGEVAQVDLESVGGFVQKIAGAGIPIGGHPDTENALRRMVGLPEVDEEVFAEREAQEQEDRELQLEAQQAEVDALRARQGQKPPPAR